MFHEDASRALASFSLNTLSQLNQPAVDVRTSYYKLQQKYARVPETYSVGIKCLFFLQRFTNSKFKIINVFLRIFSYYAQLKETTQRTTTARRWRR